MKNTITYYIIFLVAIFSVSAQQVSKELIIDSVKIERKQLNERQINSYKNKKAFNYNVEEAGPSLYEQISEWINRVLRKFFSWFFDDVETPVGFFMLFLNTLPYIIAVIVLYLMINFFLKINSKNILNGQTNKNIIQIEDDEELLNSKDLPRLIKLAENDKDYRLATRYQYVLLLQKLSNREYILWEQQKTNEDYIKELALKNIQADFENITRFYDFVWYGNFKVNEQEYQSGILQVTKIEEKIK